MMFLPVYYRSQVDMAGKHQIADIKSDKATDRHLHIGVDG